MKEPYFKVGDKVTYKSRKDCINKYDKTGAYYYVGNEQGGYRGEVLDIDRYVPSRNCYSIIVKSKEGGNYMMLENEFKEFSDAIRINNMTIEKNIFK